MTPEHQYDEDKQRDLVVNPEQREQELAVRSPASGYSDKPLYVRVLLEATAGANTNTCSSLSWLEVSAAFEEPLGE